MIKKLLNKISGRLYYSKWLNPNIVDSIFVVSTGRTGTKFFETFFNAIDAETFAVHEPQPDFFDLGIRKIRNAWSTRQIEEYIHGQRGVYLRSFTEQRKKKYVECNPFLSLLLKEVKSVFKKARFIIITREPKSYVKSALNKSPLDDGAFYFYGKNDKRLRMRSLDFDGDSYQDQWEQFTRLEKISWYWNKCNLVLLDYYQNNKNHCLHIKFEDIFSKDKEQRFRTIGRMLAFLNINLDKETVRDLIKLIDEKDNMTKEVIYGGIETWTEEEKENFYILTEEALKRIEEI